MRAVCLFASLLLATAASAQDAGSSRPSFGTGDERTEAVLALTVPFAIDMLNEQGGFAPFGLGSASGAAALIPVHLAEEGVPMPEVTQRTIFVLRQMATDGLPESILSQAPDAVLEAAVVCMDTYTDVPGRGRTEAVAVVVEARGSQAKTYYQPYIREETGIRYLDAYVAENAPLIFAEQ